MFTYVVYDGQDCLGVFNKIKDVQQHIEFLSNICHRHGGELDFKKITVNKFNQHLVKGQYIIDNSINLIPKILNEDSDINLFIPLETECVKQHPDELRKKVEYLEQIKAAEERELENIRKEQEKYTQLKHQEYIEEKARLDKIKQDMKKDQERWEEIEKKFHADKKLYFIFKDEIAKGQRNDEDIPLLFKDTYPIFKQLDEDNKLNTDDEIKNYLEQTKYYRNTIFMTSEFDDLFAND
jgi:hypothetical protein